MEKDDVLKRWLSVVTENARLHQYLFALLPDHADRCCLAAFKGQSGHVTEFWPVPQLFDQSCHFCLLFNDQIQLHVHS
jgi:hypothetical protein